ncbi:hypothetical protein J3R83DRAFT_3988 [Lanmaoa asiatica]|nr:hypothetical protein J3R83DRAFT_3988 [Lanmaoa asiatica]
MATAVISNRCSFIVFLNPNVASENCDDLANQMSTLFSAFTNELLPPTKDTFNSSDQAPSHLPHFIAYALYGTAFHPSVTFAALALLQGVKS